MNISDLTTIQGMEIFTMGNNAIHPNVLEMFVLDVLQHDVAEQLPSIVRMLNNDGCIGWRKFWPHDFKSEEVTWVLRKLFVDGLIRVLREDQSTSELIACDPPDWESSLEPHWFGTTALGKRAWNDWEPPVAT